jgi:hypothetical protein
MSRRPRFGAELSTRGVSFGCGRWRRTGSSSCSTTAIQCGPPRKAGTKSRLRRERAGLLYKFHIDGEIDVPDPASSFQPEGDSGSIDQEHYA